MHDAQNTVDENWAFMYDVVETLGLDGMSSDESEPEENGTRRPYKKVRVKTRVWRSKTLESYLKLIDRERNFKNALGNDPAGTKPTIRVRPAHNFSSTRFIPPHLPRNFYDNDWYNGLTAKLRAALQAGPPMELIEFEDDE